LRQPDGHVTVAAVEGELQESETTVPSDAPASPAPMTVPATAPHQAALSVPGQYLTRLLSLSTVAALGLLGLIASRVAANGDDFEMTGLTMPMLLVGMFWLVKFVVSMWMVRLEVSGISLALVAAALAAVGVVLGRSVPPEGPAAPMYFAFGADELAVELQFSAVCAVVVFVVWAVWATMPVARRSWPRPAIAALSVAVVLLLLAAWAAVPSYPSGFID
jgi:hypothetical protein